MVSSEKKTYKKPNNGIVDSTLEHSMIQKNFIMIYTHAIFIQKLFLLYLFLYLLSLILVRFSRRAE